MSWRTWVSTDFLYGRTRLAIFRKTDMGRTECITPFVIRALDNAVQTSDGDFAMIAEPGEVNAFLQAMLDAAWEQGLRPQGYVEKTDELAAVRYHLEDMRHLAKVKP